MSTNFANLQNKSINSTVTSQKSEYHKFPAKDKEETAMLSTEFNDGKYQKLNKAKVFHKRKCESNKVTKLALLHQHIRSCEL
jgi:hypothetical protein